jgi:hypothetical protein
MTRLKTTSPESHHPMGSVICPTGMPLAQSPGNNDAVTNPAYPDFGQAGASPEPPKKIDANTKSCLPRQANNTGFYIFPSKQKIP